MASGAVERRTPGLGLAEIRFNFPNWGDEFNKNMRVVDAILTPISGEIEGPWEILTAYTIGQRVVSTQTAIVYVCEVSHTSASTGTLEDELIDNPSYWRSVTGTANFRGEWVTGTTYYNNDYVTRLNAYYISTDQHQSGVFATDLAAGKWSLLVDLNPFILTIDNAADAAVLTINDAVTTAQGTITSAVNTATAAFNATVTSVTTQINTVADDAVDQINLAVTDVEANLQLTADQAIAAIAAFVDPVNDAADAAIQAAIDAAASAAEAAAIVGFDIADYTLLVDFNTAVTVLGTATDDHIDATNNPHAVTKSQVGLGNADNTSDVNKPVSTAQAAADALKANKAGDTFTGPVSLAVGAKGTVTSGTVTFDYNDKQNWTVTVNGAVTFAYSNLPTDGSGEMNIQIAFTSGSITVPAGQRWKLPDGTLTAVFADITTKLVATNVYDKVLKYTAGTLVARIG